ncbi:ParB/RepB/Spo0J family partition protein [Polynucleobacter sphagniphilus]|jgi:ParB family chromosome partitioning protein|uniref:ParB family chromosome partitioning protein n=1 Tax=Polynucleobacter sphagniphilus TaxID=1743169 RepID=A0AA43S584_9BURK|nr:ParB/RepB/Spo0J family partition protein [Polynucleobacter sphagniphilus]MDF9789136.1 ParB family chromosome partitioning protein [Polynucleobacter sphagniphilus]MDH6155715.1 ParB family chromosome partitioning protein [Polynucleobacter sphagniphilus]MDH6242149.1 ParB family chromosome partitioning protein [Polynucleobacter sphagniphilus]MDH6299156.1 ParB family chromosome partitioning protein [Polynucleobacter sphagniphilus]MDH6302801.1 ParB family chromosome partitioning protein [Polynucl
MVAIKKKGLGRGLEALLGDKATTQAQVEINRLPLTALQAGKYQPRQKMDAGPLQELAESIREQGVMQPLLVRLVGAGKYEIIAGERRFRAATLAGLKEVPVLVSGADDQAAAAMALVENMQRQDLNPLEESQGLARLIEEFGFTHEQAAKAVGKSRSAISNLLRLIQLAKPVQAMLLAGEIDMGHARALLPLPGASQVALAQRIAAQGLSVREAERMAAALALAGGQIGDKKAKSKEGAHSPSRDPDMRRLSQEIADVIGLNAEFKFKGRGGELRIRFSQFDELDSLLRKLGVQE